MSAKPAADTADVPVRDLLDTFARGALLADKQLEIGWVNRSGVSLLSDLGDEVQATFGVEASDLAGQSLLRLVEDGTRLERAVSTRRTLPHTATVQLGEVRLHIEISALPARRGIPGYVVLFDRVDEVSATPAAEPSAVEARIEAAESAARHARAQADQARTQAREAQERAVEAQAQAARITDQLQSVLAVGAQLAGVLDAALDGDLSKRVPAGDALPAARENLNDFLEDLTTQLRNLSATARRVSGSADSLTHVAGSLASNVEETTELARAVSSASDEVNANVQAVASAAEEMTASISEIASNASQAAQVAQGAVKMARDTNETISRLGDASNEIGEVIKVITSIAQQTNLLALNATIEAARAGEAGRGFAVVANEVKELAKETARATKDIGKKIEAIQSETGKAIGAIGEIGDIIRKISEIQDNIASAVEEQSATTNEITRNAIIAASGSREISTGIDEVAKRSDTAASEVHSTQAAGIELRELSQELAKLLGSQSR